MTPTSDELALFERLIRIETKLDGYNTSSTDHEGRIRALEQDNVPGGHADHEGRLRRVERSVWLIAGAAAAGGGVVGQLIAPLLNK
jgi:hypothetical protein